VSVCLSVCLSVCHKSEFYWSSWTNQAGFWQASFFPPILHCVKRKFRYLQNRGISLWKFLPNCGLRQLCFRISIVQTWYRLSSRKVDAQSVINWTDVGQLSWQHLRAPTLDRCSLSQWSSSSVYSRIPSRGSISNSWYLFLFIVNGDLSHNMRCWQILHNFKTYWSLNLLFLSRYAIQSNYLLIVYLSNPSHPRIAHNVLLRIYHVLRVEYGLVHVVFVVFYTQLLPYLLPGWLPVMEKYGLPRYGGLW